MKSEVSAQSATKCEISLFSTSDLRLACGRSDSMLVQSPPIKSEHLPEYESRYLASQLEASWGPGLPIDLPFY